MKCQHCNLELTEDESYAHSGKTLCEDCYLEAVSRVKACDPWAVHHARSVRENLMQDPSESLTYQQNAIYEYIKSRGKVSPLELLETFGLSQREAETQLAILRHCEMVRGFKENGEIYLTTFD